ncbi:hypothetical protein [Flagellimonas amoyensis]|uniref:hypothetical protein n=1 Tax=Flagellimonas amoyensis TaxID=2169401 RepID=UPI000D34A739|nr:hypothetical protein [Allomuricauda amoyensis]
MGVNYKKHQILKHLYEFSTGTNTSIKDYDNTTHEISNKINKDISTTQTILDHLEEEIYIVSDYNNNTGAEHYFILIKGEKAYLNNEFLNQVWYRDKNNVKWAIGVIIALLIALLGIILK